MPLVWARGLERVAETELPHGKGKAETVPVDLAKSHGPLLARLD